LKIRAVVLDDDGAIKALVSNLLRERGYEVYASSEPFLSQVYMGSGCSCSVGHTCTDIIITDNNMPNMSGLKFIERQKRMGCRVQNTAVMSGSWTKEEIEHAKKLGCHVFNKPFKINEIKEWLNECEKELDHKNKPSDLYMNQTNKCQNND
jgi:CheY-like chemotaxis protein